MKWIKWLFSLQFDILNKQGFFTTARWAWPCLFYSLTPLFRLPCSVIVCKSRYVLDRHCTLCKNSFLSHRFLIVEFTLALPIEPPLFLSYKIGGVLSGQHCKSCGSQGKIVPLCGLYVFQLHRCTSVTPGNHELL